MNEYYVEIVGWYFDYCIEVKICGFGKGYNFVFKVVDILVWVFVF